MTKLDHGPSIRRLQQFVCAGEGDIRTQINLQRSSLTLFLQVRVKTPEDHGLMLLARPGPVWKGPSDGNACFRALLSVCIDLFCSLLTHYLFTLVVMKPSGMNKHNIMVMGLRGFQSCSDFPEANSWDCFRSSTIDHDSSHLSVMPMIPQRKLQ